MCRKRCDLECGFFFIHVAVAVDFTAVDSCSRYSRRSSRRRTSFTMTNQMFFNYLRPWEDQLRLLPRGSSISWRVLVSTIDQTSKKSKEKKGVSCAFLVLSLIGKTYNSEILVCYCTELRSPPFTLIIICHTQAVAKYYEGIILLNRQVAANMRGMPHKSGECTQKYE